MASDFVSKFIEVHKDFESPTSFWRWAAYITVGATLRDNVYFNQGTKKICPNIYVVFLADSAAARKGGPFPVVKNLLDAIHHTKVCKGRASIQAILEKLSQDSSGKHGSPIRGGSAVLMAEELASFFVSDTQLIPLITDIYEYQTEWSYDLRGSGFIVKNLCVSMLAASNETFLREIYDQRAVYGGLLGRTFLIKPDEIRPPNSLMDDVGEAYDVKELIDLLNQIKALKGAVKFTKAAKDRYKEWYEKLYRSYQKVPDRTGVTQRIHTGVLKLSMIVAAAHNTIEIDECHVEEAITHAISLKQNYEIYAMSSGKSSEAATGTLFLTELWNATCNNGNSLSQKKFLQNHWNQISAEDLDKLVITLERAGFIQSIMKDNAVAYVMTEKCRETFQGEMKKKTSGESK